MKSIDRGQWQQGLAAEVGRWQRWLEAARGGMDADAAADFKWRGDAGADMSAKDYLLGYLKGCPPGASVSVLDVGAGPMTYFPKRWMTRRVTITAIDPLAEAYGAMLSAAQVEAPVSTVAGEAEKLDEQFAAGAFDLVFCRNALEQMYDPVKGLRKMMGVLKPGRWVVLLQEGQRDSEEARRAPWRMDEEDGEVVVGAGTDRFSLNDELPDAEVRVVKSWHWPWVLVGVRGGGAG